MQRMAGQAADEIAELHWSPPCFFVDAGIMTRGRNGETLRGLEAAAR
jgi:hypothetical protein